MSWSEFSDILIGGIKLRQSLNQFNFQMDGKEGEEKIQEIKKNDSIIKDEEELIEEKEISLLNDLVSFLNNLKKRQTKMTSQNLMN
jgi:hypothetical protein